MKREHLYNRIDEIEERIEQQVQYNNSAETQEQCDILWLITMLRMARGGRS